MIVGDRERARDAKRRAPCGDYLRDLGASPAPFSSRSMRMRSTRRLSCYAILGVR